MLYKTEISLNYILDIFRDNVKIAIWQTVYVTEIYLTSLHFRWRKP